MEAPRTQVATSCILVLCSRLIVKTLSSATRSDAIHPFVHIWAFNLPRSPLTVLPIVCECFDVDLNFAIELRSANTRQYIYIISPSCATPLYEFYLEETV